MKVSTIIVVSILLTLSLGVYVRAADEGPNDVNASNGRYQVATSYRDAGNWVFVTVIDTRTGAIVRKERYGGFNDYKEVK